MLETGIKTVGIDHTVLHVSNLAASKAFYMNILGMAMNHESSWQAFLRCGEQQVALFEVKEGTSISSGNDLNHMALRLNTGTYEEVKSNLERHGCTVTGRPGDDHCIYFHDPDGHRLQLLIPGEH